MRTLSTIYRGGFLKIISVGIPTYVKTSFYADFHPRNRFSRRWKQSLKTHLWAAKCGKKRDLERHPANLLGFFMDAFVISIVLLSMLISAFAPGDRNSLEGKGIIMQSSVVQHSFALY